MRKTYLVNCGDYCVLFPTLARAMIEAEKQSRILKEHEVFVATVSYHEWRGAGWLYAEYCDLRHVRADGLDFAWSHEKGCPFGVPFEHVTPNVYAEL